MAAPLNIADYRQAARRRLPRGLFEFLDRGSEDDVAVTNNRTSFDALRLRPRILAGAAPRSLRTEAFGTSFALPVMLAPVGIAGYLWHEGEAALARAAAVVDVPFILSGASTLPLEAVARASAAEKWFQLYVSGDHERTIKLVRRAREAGYAALVLTADSLVPYNREFAKRSGFDIPLRLRPWAFIDMLAHPRWLLGTMGRYLRQWRMPTPVDYPMPPPGHADVGRFAMKDDRLNWAFLDRLRGLWPGRLVVKGVLDPRDAKRCVEAGIDGIVVSNHGGIALDGAVAPIDALPAIVAAAGGRTTIMLDGGVRRGSDVIKALALGADMVGIGRSAMYALATAGQPGVVQALRLLEKEMDCTLAQLGCRGVRDLSPDYVTRLPCREGTR